MIKFRIVVGTGLDLSSVIPAKARNDKREGITFKDVWRMVPCDSNEAKSLHAPLPVNSLLGTFTSGQTNAYGVRHVPYLTSLRRFIILRNGFS